MKKAISVLLTAITAFLFVFSGARASAAAGTVDVTKYSYEIIPVISPFSRYLYVRTDNPDPVSFRLVDKNSVLYGKDAKSTIVTSEGGGWISTKDLDPGTYYVCRALFPDVAYKDEAAWRVNGGYIFMTRDAYSDGGEFTLLQQTGGTDLGSLTYKETSVKVSAPKMTNPIGYLIDRFTDRSKGLFENLDAVQAGLDKLAIYPRSVYDSDSPNEDRPYPLLAASPYEELTYNEHYDMYNAMSEGMLASKAFPLVLDSLGFPGTMASVAQALDPNAVVESGDMHWEIKVTSGGTTKVYGGAGKGGNDPLYSERVNVIYTFADAGKLPSVDKVSDILYSYEAVAAADAAKYYDLIAGRTFRDTIAATGGTWVRVATEGWFGFGATFGYLIPFAGGVRIISDAWVDGHYINTYERVELGTKFEEHPTAGIVVRNMTYTDINGDEHTQDVLFEYDAAADNWSAKWTYANNWWISTDAPIPDEFILTREEVDAMDVTKGGDRVPESGLVYDGTEYPGTPFKNVLVTGVVLEPELTLKVGSDAILEATVIPSDALEGRVTWTSSDPKTVEVEEQGGTSAKLTAKKPGKATVTATTVDGSFTAECAVTVPEYASGDVNRDGKINAKDVTSIMKYLVGNVPKVFNAAAADFDEDGKINAKDVTKLMKFIVS